MIQLSYVVFGLILGFVNPVLCHGSLKTIQVNGQDYPAWQVGQDDYVTPPPVRYARKLRDVGPVPDFTTPDIT